MLAEAITDEATQVLYAGLASAEVRHRDTFLELAAQVSPETWRDRLAVLAKAESDIIAKLPIRARIH
jgi:tRNA isopentenyl-2-thiomethyl-A-37 hydroxylase MiaE